MIEKTDEEKLQDLNQELIKIGVMETPALALLGLGVYGRFVAQGAAFHPLLNDSTVVNSLLIIGGVLLLLSTNKIITWARKRRELIAQINT